MIWDDDRLGQLRLDAIADADLTTATVVLELTDPAGTVTVHAADWTGAATTASRWDTARREQVTEWRRSALTAGQFGGSSVAPGAGRTILTPGRWVGEWHITIGGSVAPSPVFTLDVH